jgi:hypothetical protein
MEGIRDLCWSLVISRWRIAIGLTNRWSQPLAGVMTRFDFMKQLSMLRKLAAASGGSAPSR